MNLLDCPGVSPFAHPGELPFFRVENAFASAVFSPYGAHVLSYIPAGEREVLFLSGKSAFACGKPIRGGIPVCWPYFGPAPDGGPAHGYARIASWEVLEVKLGPAGHAIRLKLPGSALPPEFAGLEAEAVLRIGPALEVTLTTVNRSDAPVEISDALHSYFAVSDCRKVTVSGLSGARYQDKVDSDEKVQQGDVILDHEVDHIYLDTESVCLISDPEWQRRIRVAKSGSRSTVVWNPWIAKSRRMEDFGDEEYFGMVCVESTNAASDKRMLKPGESHTLGTMLSVEPF